MRTFFATLPILVAAGLQAQRVAEIEPNDTVAQAQPILAGRHIVANLAAGEQDWYSFTLASAAEIHLQTSGNFSVNPSVDTVVLLYDSTGQVRLAWNDNQRGTMSDCGVNLQPGSYTCLVMGKTTTVTGDYGLDFVVLPAAVIDVVEAAEPNGDPMLGGYPTPIVLGQTFTGDLSSPTDSDWYTFTLTTAGVVQAAVYDDGGVPQLDNTNIKLYQEHSPGSYVAVGSASTQSTGHRALTLAHPASLPPGNYAIEITAGSAATGTAPFDYAKMGKYGVRTRFIALGAGNSVSESAEPNNTAPTAAYMNIGDSAYGNISGSNEGDWYGFTVSGPTTIVAMADSWGSSPITDTTVKLMDRNGGLLTSASSGGTSSHGRVVYTLPQAGLYFIEVSGGVFAATGDYVLLTGSCAPMFVASSFHAEPPSTNACPGSNSLRPALTVASSETPQLGSTFVIRLQNALPNAIALPFYGFSRLAANGGSVPLPFDLTAVGAPGCFVRVDPASTSLAVADATGVSYLELPVPAILALRGLPFFMQAVLLDPANNALGVSVTNDASFLLGERGY